MNLFCTLIKEKKSCKVVNHKFTNFTKCYLHNTHGRLALDYKTLYVWVSPESYDASIPTIFLSR